MCSNARLHVVTLHCTLHTHTLTHTHTMIQTFHTMFTSNHSPQIGEQFSINMYCTDGSKLDMSSEDGYDVIIHKVGNGSGHLHGFQGLQSGHPGDHSDGYKLMVPKSAVVPRPTKAPPNNQEAIENREALA